MTFKERAKSFFTVLGAIYGLMLILIPLATAYEYRIPYLTAFTVVAVTLIFPATMISLILFGLSELIPAHSTPDKKPTNEV